MSRRESTTAYLERVHGGSWRYDNSARHWIREHDGVICEKQGPNVYVLLEPVSDRPRFSRILLMWMRKTFRWSR